MVLITPQLVRPLDPDEVPPLPIAPEALPAGPGSGATGGGGLVDAPPASSAPKPAPVIKKDPEK